MKSVVLRLVTLLAMAAPLTLWSAAPAGHWDIVISPNPDQYNHLNAVACASASDCWAVGSYYNSPINATQTLIERNTGTGWAIASSPNASGSPSNILNGVTCAGPADCWAVGYSSTLGTGISQTLILRNTGSGWAVVSSPNTGTGQNNTLNGVTCAGPNDCIAVGYAQFQSRGVNQTLILRNTGSGWAIVSSPNGTNPNNSNFLYGVSCAGPANCWAVGSNPNAISTAFQTLIEQDTGSGWAIVSSPNSSAAQSNYLYGVACAGASDCWAVGYYFNNVTGNVLYQTLILRNTGSGWAIVGSPNDTATPGYHDILFGVTCAGPADCWAVGTDTNKVTGIAKTLIERNTGSGWAIVSSPNTNISQSNYLYGVACAGASDCWAVGYYHNTGAAHDQTLIEHYTVDPPPDLTATKTHSGNFTQGQTGVTYTLTANNISAGATSGSVSVADTLPGSLTAAAIAGTGWACTLATLTCTRNDVLAAGSSYPAITLTVNVADNAPASVTNLVTVSGGGESNTINNTATDPTTITPANRPPTAVLTASPTSGVAPLPVSLDASRSSDPDSADFIASYTFDFGDGSASLTQPQATVQHSYSSAGNYTATVSVTDSYGLSSTSAATAQITVTAPNRPPVANAGADFTVDEGAATALNGAASTDPDREPLAYAWTQIAGPPVTLTNANTATPSFTAPSVSTDTPLAFRLTVSDPAGATSSDDITVTVRNVNLPPVANAGQDFSINEGESAMLSGSNSSDPDGEPLGYAWVQIAGPAVTLSNANTATASFTAPPVTADTPLTFRLTVSDPAGATSSDDITVTVRNVVAPPEPTTTATENNHPGGGLSSLTLLALGLLGLLRGALRKRGFA